MAYLPILIFHSLDEWKSAISFPPQAFRRGLAMLYESGYRTLGLLQVVNRLQRGQSFPPRSFVITFDDGYQSVYDQAFPILQGYGMSATIFLTTGKSGPAKPTDCLPPAGDQAMLSWTEIREMHRWGINIGVHTCTHPDLTRLASEQVETETHRSKAIIEDMLGAPVWSFAYPYGRFDQRSYEIARRHFGCACSGILSLATPSSDPYTLERIDAYYLRPSALFDLIVTAWFPWYVRFRGIAHRARCAAQRSIY